MSDWYELIGQTPVRIEGDIIEKSRRFGMMDRRVALTNLFDGLCTVSTVFLGLDHSSPSGLLVGRQNSTQFIGRRPLLFETMAFWQEDGAQELERCSTWPEAEEQHARMCAECVCPGAVVRYAVRRLTSRWAEARRDFDRRWKEMRGVELTDLDRLELMALDEGW